ncbi:MAG: class I SAM-dependent methyltransferase [Nanoarchaeota archaeon]
MKFVKKDYDSSYFNTWVEKLPLEKMFNKDKVKLIHSIKPSGKLLEIGCGRGKLLNELKKDYSVFGTDISKAAIIESSKLIDKKNLRVSNIEKEPIKEKYDIILAFDVLEHLKNPDKTIKNIKKSLKKDGVFIFSVPNNYGLFGKMMTAFFNYTDKTHVSTFKRKKWIEIMKNAGFKSDIRNQHSFGISKWNIAKFYSFNLIMLNKI